MSKVREEIYKPYLGVGKVYLKSLAEGAAGGHYEIGNVSELRLSIDEDVIEQPDYTQPGGGTYAEVRRVQGVTVNAVLHDFNDGNLELATRGVATQKDSGSVSDEKLTLHKGSLLRLAQPLDAADASVVIVDASAGDTTYEDYEVRAEGIYVPLDGDLATADSGSGVEVKVSYSHKAYTNIEALTSAGAHWALSFGGLNEADSGKPVIVDLHKVVFGATDELALISDELGQISLEGKCLKDTSKGSGESSFYRVQKA